MVMWHSSRAALRAALSPVTTPEVIDGCDCEGCARIRVNRTPTVHTLNQEQAVDTALSLVCQLTGQTWESIRGRGHVYVTGNEGGNYRLYLGSYSGNIGYQHPGGYLGWSELCAHLTTAREVTLIENILAQVLMIKTDEAALRRMAG